MMPTSLVKVKTSKKFKFTHKKTVKYLEKWSAKIGFYSSIGESICITFTRKTNVGKLNVKMDNKKHKK